MTGSRHPGLITPGNAPRLADLNDGSAPYPSQITVFCDNCGVENTGDYLVPADSTSHGRFEIARGHLRSTGWHCSGAGDYCTDCAPTQTQRVIAEIAPVLAEVFAEQVRQVTKFGEQHREDGTGGPVMRSESDRMRAACDHLARSGGADWRAVLLEEVYEALAEDDPLKLRAELLQVAAVCATWVQDIDSREAPVQ